MTSSDLIFLLHRSVGPQLEAAVTGRRRTEAAAAEAIVAAAALIS